MNSSRIFRYSGIIFNKINLLNHDNGIRCASNKIANYLHTYSRVRSGSLSPILFEANNNISSKILELPEKINHGFLGDQLGNKLPIFDFNKTNNPLYFGSPLNSIRLVNSNIVPLSPNDPFGINTDLNWNYRIIANIYRNVSLPQNQIQPMHLPTTKSNANNEKRADYYKHKDPRRFTHLIWVRHRKMKKHQRLKWRKKNLAMIKRRILERNIAKEKQFRAELLAQIKEAEDFDPKAYVNKILYTIDNVPQLETREEKLERYKDLIRKNRTQTNFILPKFEKIED